MVCVRSVQSISSCEHLLILPVTFYSIPFLLATNIYTEYKF